MMVEIYEYLLTNNPSLKWSNSLSYAALHYVNKKGLLGASDEATIQATAEKQYAKVICED